MEPKRIDLKTKYTKHPMGGGGDMSKYHGNPERCLNCSKEATSSMDEEFKEEYCSPSCEEEFNIWIQGFIYRSTGKEEKER